jgi:hypothetical protein
MNARRPCLVTIMFLSLSLFAGFTLGVLPTGHSALALDHDDQNNCTGTVADPAQLGPYTGTVGSGGIWWTEAPCTECPPAQGPPAEHATEIALTGSKACPTQSRYVGSIYVTFCEPMYGVSAGTKIGVVTFYTNEGNKVVDLTLFNSTTGYAVVRCSTYLRAVPYKVKVQWGHNYDGDNPARGNALLGFDILVQCCDL